MRRRILAPPPDEYTQDQLLIPKINIIHYFINYLEDKYRNDQTYIQDLSLMTALEPSLINGMNNIEARNFLLTNSDNNTQNICIIFDNLIIELYNYFSSEQMPLLQNDTELKRRYINEYNIIEHDIKSIKDRVITTLSLYCPEDLEDSDSN